MRVYIRFTVFDCSIYYESLGCERIPLFVFNFKILVYRRNTNAIFFKNIVHGKDTCNTSLKKLTKKRSLYKKAL